MRLHVHLVHHARPSGGPNRFDILKRHQLEYRFDGRIKPWYLMVIYHEHLMIISEKDSEYIYGNGRNLLNVAAGMML